MGEGGLTLMSKCFYCGLMKDMASGGQGGGFTSGVYTTYFGGVKKLVSEYFSHLVIPEGMYSIFYMKVSLF